MSWKDKRLTKEYEERNRNILPTLKGHLAAFYEDMDNPEYDLTGEQKDRMMKHINYLQRSILDIEGSLEEI